MIFVIAAIFILVVSFVIALVSLIKEQSKIEKAAADVSLGTDQISVQQPQVIEKKTSEPDLTNVGMTQPKPPLEPQPQPTVSSLDYNAIPLKEKPWWEKEIQKRNEEESGRAIDWQNTGQVQRPPVADVFKTEESGKVLESHDRLGAQTTQEKDQNLEGSFSVSDLAKGDQES